MIFKSPLEPPEASRWLPGTPPRSPEGDPRIAQGVPRPASGPPEGPPRLPGRPPNAPEDLPRRPRGGPRRPRICPESVRGCPRVCRVVPEAPQRVPRQPREPPGARRSVSKPCFLLQTCQFGCNYRKCTLELDSHKQSSHVPVPGSPWRFLNSPCSSLTPVPMDTAVTRSVFNPPYPSGIHGVLFLAVGSSGSWRR